MPMVKKNFLLNGILVLAVFCFYSKAQTDPLPPQKIPWVQPSPGQIPFGGGWEAVSEIFRGAPFRNNALGEGPGHHDSDPLSRLDAFDCTTFVETVWALSLNADQGKSWSSDLQKIRYKQGEIAFSQRLHFISLDWMPYHAKRGALDDITGDLGIPLMESVTTIDRVAWYKKMHPLELSDYTRRNPSAKPEIATVKYLSFKELLDNPSAIPRLKQELKKGALLANFIRPNWDTIDFIGTRIDVSHQGFLILQGDRIVLRHASATVGKVSDEDFMDYMKFYKNHATLKGLQIVRLKAL